VKRPKPARSKAKIVSGPKKAKVVSKIRRSKTKAYGTREEWTIICTKVKKRDDYKCVKCGAHGPDANLQVDHIIEVSRGGQTVMSNLRTLCAKCHSKRPSHRKAKSLILHEANKVAKAVASRKRQPRLSSGMG
jgi:5-methylcytosine-specific restriction endonuclease McrA